MKIDGIDSLIINRIKEQTDRMEVQRAEGSVTDNRVKPRTGSSERNNTYVVDQNHDLKVFNTVKRLNDNAEKNGLPFRFEARRELSIWHVDVYDSARKQVVRNIPDIPVESVLTVLNRINSLFGVLVDERR